MPILESGTRSRPCVPLWPEGARVHTNQEYTEPEILTSARLKARDKEAADKNPHMAATSALVSPG